MTTKPNNPPAFLTWDDLADFYKKKTGRTARIKPMDEIFAWAIKQPEIKQIDDGLIMLVEREKERV